MRLFVGIDLPDALADAVADAQTAFAETEGLNCTDAEQAHVTLTFLGDVDDERLAAVTDAVAAGVADAGVGPFTAAFGGYGVFPSLDYISVVWLGVREGAAEMTRLHEGIETATTALGFEADEHAFTPHVTLARMNDARSKEHVRDVVRERDPDVGTARVEDVRLIESTLTSDGPVYETVESFEL